MSKSDCKKCEFWREWGFPFIIVLLFIIVCMGYYTITFYNDNQACLSVFNQTVLERNDLAKNITNIDEIISAPNVFKFCQNKGFENGGYSSYSCSGVMCITSNMENGTMVTKTGCYKFSELIE